MAIDLSPPNPTLTLPHACVPVEQGEERGVGATTEGWMGLSHR